MQRRQDVIDDSFSSEGVDDLSDNIFEPPEVIKKLDYSKSTLILVA